MWGPHGKSPRKQPSGVQEVKAGGQEDTGDQDAAAGVRQRQGENHQAWAGAKRPVSSQAPAGTQLGQSTAGCPRAYAPLTVQQEQEKPKHRRLEPGDTHRLGELWVCTCICGEVADLGYSSMM